MIWPLIGREVSFKRSQAAIRCHNHSVIVYKRPLWFLCLGFHHDQPMLSRFIAPLTDPERNLPFWSLCPYTVKGCGRFVVLVMGRQKLNIIPINRIRTE